MAMVATQLADRSLLTPNDPGSNPAISKFLCCLYLLSTLLKDKKYRKYSWKGWFKGNAHDGHFLATDGNLVTSLLSTYPPMPTIKYLSNYYLVNCVFFAFVWTKTKLHNTF